jgi:hypothetical protein
MSELEKNSTGDQVGPGRERTSGDSYTRLIFTLLDSYRQRRDRLVDELKTLENEMLANPDSRHASKLETIVKNLEETDQKQEDLLLRLAEYGNPHREQLHSLWDRMYELEKHVTTLSTASILGVAALAQLFPASSDLKSAVATSLVCFLIAIVTAIFAMAVDNLEMLHIGSDKTAKTWLSRIRGAAFWTITQLAWVSRPACLAAFCIGLVTIVRFIIKIS